MSRRRVAILISGAGSNMAALIRAMQAPGHPARPVLVFSNDPAAPGLSSARGLGVPTAAADHRRYPDRASFDAEVQRALEAARADLVACAGYMRIMTDGLVEAWRGRMLNVHPSLLPLFKGLHTHARALETGVAIHGCTVHEVVPELDAGRILGQAAVPVLPGDTEDTLAARVLRQEHRLYPAALAALARGA
ncbi:MAG TPA: phosphoribosylglycinamide formyltransferase, partial [Paracoccaceae bacterium]|nr:phosphoribosylglycinamide formyltransferase [Paracoccaceae bacterium]